MISFAVSVHDNSSITVDDVPRRLFDSIPGKEIAENFQGRPYWSKVIREGRMVMHFHTEEPPLNQFPEREL